MSGIKCPGIKHGRSSNKGATFFGCLIASSKYARLCGGEYIDLIMSESPGSVMLKTDTRKHFPQAVTYSILLFV